MANKFEAQENNGSTTSNAQRDPLIREREQAAPSRNREASLADPNNYMRRTMSRNPVSAAVSTAIAAIKEIPDMNSEKWKEFLDTGKLKFTTFDGELEDTEISAVLVSRREEDTVAVVALTLRATASDLGEIYIDEKRDRDDNRGGASTIIIPRVPTDVYAESKERHSRILDIIAGIYPDVADEDIHVIGQVITPPGLDITLPQNIRPLIYRTVEACDSFLVDMGVLGSNEFSFEAVPADGRLSVRPSFGGDDALDLVGNRIRSDITIETLVRQTINKGGRKSARLTSQTRVSGYMDAIFVGQSPEDSRSRDWNEDNIQSFVPAFIATELDTTTNAVTLPQLLFAIASIGFLTDNNRWIAAFNPMYAQRHKDRFVGALGKDLPMPGTPIRNNVMEYMPPITPDATFDYIDFCRQAFYLDHLVVAVDIEEGGQVSPVLNIIQSAARGVAVSEDACVAALDFLFGGNVFSELWKDAGRPALFRTDETRIPLGTYVDNNGEVREVRNIDLISNRYSQDDPELAAKLANAYYGNDDEQRRLSDALEVLRMMYSTFELTGYAQRVFVTDDFFSLFREACLELKITIGPDQHWDIDRPDRGHRAYLDRGVGVVSDIFQRRGGSARTGGGRSTGWGSYGGRSR